MDPFQQPLFTDFETGSQLELPEVGAWPYSRHPSTEIYCAVFGTLEPKVWTWMPGDLVPEWLVGFIRGGGTIVAHNATFERSIWRNILVPRYGFPPVADDQWRDTQAMGLAVNLPKTLEGLARALGCPAQKDMEGHKLMLKMAEAVEEPEPGRYIYPMATEANLKRLAEYCELDVMATAGSWLRLPQMSITEHMVWLADQEVNTRGVYLDREFAQQCLKIADQRKQQLDNKAFAITTGELNTASASPSMKTWVKNQGVKLRKAPRVRKNGEKHMSECLDANAVQALLDKPDTPPNVRALLTSRQEAGKVTSLAKLKRVDMVVDPEDGRFRHALQFCAANTGRWASYLLQLHNLPKVWLSDDEIKLARTIVEHGNLELLALCFDRPLHVLSQLLRSIVAAKPGYELIAGDYSAIEARVVAWLAGQLDIVDRFAVGEDVYTYVAERIGSDERQLGKVCQLMLGFGAGAVKSQSTFANWGVHLSLKETAQVVKTWRSQNDKIVQLWGDLEDAAFAAVVSPGQVFSVGVLHCLVDEKRNHLRIFLPSGRALHYWRPRIAVVRKKVPVVDEEGEIQTVEFESPTLQFWQVGQDKNSMQLTDTYSGKLVENVTQAVARELLGHSLLVIRKHGGYPVVMHVHDSLAAEVRRGARSVEEFEHLMEITPAWAAGLPVAAEGYRDTRFRG